MAENLHRIITLNVCPWITVGYRSTDSILSLIFSYFSFSCSPIIIIFRSLQTLYSVPDLRTLRKQTCLLFQGLTQCPLCDSNTYWHYHLSSSFEEWVSLQHFNTNAFHLQISVVLNHLWKSYFFSCSFFFSLFFPSFIISFYCHIQMLFILFSSLKLSLKNLILRCKITTTLIFKPFSFQE